MDEKWIMNDEKWIMKTSLTSLEAWTGQRSYVKEGEEESVEPVTLSRESNSWPQNSVFEIWKFEPKECLLQKIKLNFTNVKKQSGFVKIVNPINKNQT